MSTLRSPMRTIPAFADDQVVDVPPFGACRRADIWDAWCYAQAEVEVAYRAWTSTPHGPERREHHLAYRAGLEREERAAYVLAVVITATEVRC
jgi:hypothetical protein